MKYHFTLFLFSITFSLSAQIKHLLGTHIAYVASYTPSNENLPTYAFGTFKANKLAHDGLSAGLLYRFQIKRIYFQIQPQYLNTGFGFESPEEVKKRSSYFERYDFTFHYLSVPLQAGCMVVNKSFKFGLEAGASYNYRLKTDVHYLSQSPNETIDTRLNVPSKEGIVCAHLGLRIGADIGKSSTIEFTPHYARSLQYAFENFKIDYLGFGVMFGYYLHKGL